MDKKVDDVDLATSHHRRSRKVDKKVDKMDKKVDKGDRDFA